jgi:hypothetical protein
MLFKQAAFVGLGVVLGVGIGIGIPKASAQGSSPKLQSVRDFPDLVGGLKATPGCLDAREGSLNQGKQFAIFAWFKNKAAVNAWYNGKMHRDAMKKYFPNYAPRPLALEGFKDAKAPLLVAATITPSDTEGVQGTHLAISQIAIEIYTPVSGGLQFGGGFGPKSLIVPGMIRG